jgi:hypothetical protein
VLLAGIVVMSTIALSPSSVFSQVQAPQSRIPQSIVVNGQTANGAYVVTSTGQIQSYTCPAPQRFSAADGSSQGWACYEQTSGVWLLSAVPPQDQVTPVAPAQVTAPQPASPPPVIYRQAPPVVVYPQTPVVVYQTPTVVYQQPPAVLYEPAPTVVYAPAPRTVVVAPAYPSSVVLGRAAIEAAGRIASAAILNSHHTDVYIRGVERDRGRRW